MTAKKRPVKTSGKTSVMIQPHGGYLTPGNPGNKGGTGRPPSEIRKTAALAFDQRIPVLTQIADNKESRDSDRIKAVETLGRVGLNDNAVARSAVWALLKKLSDAITDEATRQTFSQIVTDWEMKL